MREFSFSTRIFFGHGALERLAQVCRKRVLLVTDRFMVESGTADKVCSHLTDCQVTVFDSVTPDPSIRIVAQGVQALLSCRAEVMIALGGGSPIDAAKAIRAMAANVDGLPPVEECFAIPTTSGTGSEVSEFAVITDTEKGIKYPLMSRDLRAPNAILDPELVSSAPASVTADTGMDVLTHALEALVAVNASDFSDALAEKAIALTCRFLPAAVANGGDLMARERMHNASCMAGLAFNSAGLGLCHGIAHALGGKLHLSHGRLNAMLLPHILRFNAELDHPGGDTLPARKYQHMAKLLYLPASTARLGVYSLTSEIERLTKTIGILGHLDLSGEAGVQYRSLRPAIVQAALEDRCTSGNPRQASGADVEALLSCIE